MEEKKREAHTVITTTTQTETITRICANCTHYLRQQFQGRITGRCRLSRNQTPRTQTGCSYWETNDPEDLPPVKE